MTRRYEFNHDDAEKLRKILLEIVCERLMVRYILVTGVMM